MEWFQHGMSIMEVPIFDVLKEVKAEKIRLPLYQRDSVWSEGRVCALWDSLLRGFPLPSFLLVDGNGESRPLASGAAMRELSKKDGHPYFDLLDGQQRLTAILRAMSATKEPAMRLWIDLTPPPADKKKHPFKFKYWLHPCTNVFPFGFRMEPSGEHDFSPLHDRETREIWDMLQHSSDQRGKEFYEVPLEHTFPWHAQTPVPLDELVRLVEDARSTQDPAVLGGQAVAVANAYREKHEAFYGEKLKQYRPRREEADKDVVALVAAALVRLKAAKLVFQLIDLPVISDVDDDSYTLFERIGRGGVQISQRQLAVSSLMQVIGQAGNNAVASFQKTKWGHILNTEDIIHSLARVAHALVKPLPSREQPEFERKLQEWDMPALSIERLKTLKKDKSLWPRFQSALQALSEPLRLQNVFDRVFEEVLQYDAESNPHGLSLVQLAQTGRSSEGIAAITLHPILLYYFKGGENSPKDRAITADLLRWIVFANGIVKERQSDRMNRLAFWQVLETGRLEFALLKARVFEDDKTRAELGLAYDAARIAKEGTISLSPVDPLGIPTPLAHVEKVARRLVLQNWACHGLSKFVLMWSQRKALHGLYGDTDGKYIPALYSKGRPVDLDHIVARSKFLYSVKGITGESIGKGTEFLFKEKGTLKKVVLHDGSFRKNLPNTNANYRYWPKHLNRADQDRGVKAKMELGRIKDISTGHPLSSKLGSAHDDTPWEWSAIAVQDRQDWESLPPDDSAWNEGAINKFARVMLKRQYYLYAGVYGFLMPGCESGVDFQPDGLIQVDA